MSKKINDIEKSLNIYERIKNEIIKFINFIKINGYKVNLKELTEKEKIIINRFYNSDLKEYTLSTITLAETTETYPIILKLVKRNILENLTDWEKIDRYDGNGIKYKLTAKAWKKLNKLSKKYVTIM